MKLSSLIFGLIFATVFTLLAPFAQAQDDLSLLTMEGTIKAESAPEAARAIQAQVTAEAARSQVISIIGEKRYQKHKSIVESRIVRQSSKFIPFVNPGAPIQTPDGNWKMVVELKLSQASLRKMVLDAGLLNDAEGPASILPLIAFTDRKAGVGTRWWLGESRDENRKFITLIQRNFHDKLQVEFARQGFHVIKPQGTIHSPVPEVYRTEQPSATELQFISDYFHAPMVIRGEVRSRESKNNSSIALITVKLQVLQAATSRSIAEVSRTVEADPGAYEASVRNKLASESTEVAKDLAAQVLEAWQRGTLNTNLLRLSVRGTLSPKQLADFKAGLLQNVKDIKALKERSFEGTTVQFEADYTGAVAPLAEKMKALSLPNFEARLAEASENGVVLDVRSR